MRKISLTIRLEMTYDVHLNILKGSTVTRNLK